MTTRKPDAGKSRETSGSPRKPEAAPKPAGERARLSQNPNLNQADNERGSADQASGSQTGADLE